MKRLLWVACAVVLVAAALPFIPLDFLRAPIARSLEQGLGRKIEIGSVHFTLLPGVLPGPGFTLDEVTIHEDPRAGIEPFAYMDSLSASVRLRSVLARRLEFSSLNLGDATINVVKTSEGPWNFQYLLGGAATNARVMPSIRMRAGRVNFKYGDTKSTFYFNDADLDVAPYQDGSVELRFGGAPSRTDRAAQEFGRLFVRGNASPGTGQLNFSVELEKSSLEEAARWIGPVGLGVQGNAALQVQLSGPPSGLAVLGTLQLEGVHRGDVPAAQGGSWQLPFKGTLDLSDERLDLVGPQDAAFGVRLHAANWQSTPEWEIAGNVREVAFGTVLKIARYLGAPLPQQATAEGSVSGTLALDSVNGWEGKLAFEEASLTLPDTPPLRAAEAIVTIAAGAARLARTMVTGENRAAEIEGTYSLTEPGETDFKITTRGLDVRDMSSFAMTGIPVLRDTPAGVWQGWARYKAEVWTGDFALRDAKIAVDGIAEPVTIESAAVSVNGGRVVVSRMQAHAGGIAFQGTYRYEPAAERPHQFAISIPEADAEALAAIFAPLWRRPEGFLSRTLRLGSQAPDPAWLEARHAEGTIAIESLVLHDVKARAVSVRVQWDASKVRLAGVAARIETATLGGDVRIELSGRAPNVRFEGKLLEVPYRGGSLDWEGTAEADEADGLRAEGKLRGRALTFAPDAEFRNAAASFEVQGAGTQAKWKFTNVEVNQGGEVFSGTGGIQADGKLLLDLASRGRPLHVSATLFAPPAQP